MVTGKGFVCSDHEDILKECGSTKLLNEPNNRAAPSTSCSETSTVASDSEAECAGPTKEKLVKTVLKAQLEKKIAQSINTNGGRRQSHGDSHFFSDSSEAGDENVGPAANRKRGRKPSRKVREAEGMDDTLSGVPKIQPKAPKEEGELSSSNGSTPPRSSSKVPAAAAKVGGGANSRRSSTQSSKESRPSTPKSGGKKGKNGGGEAAKNAASSPVTRKSVDSPMFDDTDSDDFPNLVIDIP